MTVPPPPDETVPRRRTVAVALLTLGAAALWPFLVESPGAHATGSQLFAVVLVGLSLTVSVGWLRVVTLYQPAAAAAGAAATAAAVVHDLGPLVALASAVAAGAATGLVGLLPALGGPRRWLPASSLLVAAAAVLLVPRTVIRPFAPPVLFGVDLAGTRAQYLAGLAVVAGAGAFVSWLRGTGAGRRVRLAGSADVDAGPPRASAGGGVDAGAWAAGIALSGALAGVSGSLTTLLHQGVPSPLDFAPTTAVAYLAVPLVAGAGSVVWPRASATAAAGSVPGAIAGAAVFLAAARLGLAAGLPAVTLPAAIVVVAAAFGWRRPVV